MDYAFNAIIWTCVALFVVTGVVTLLALLNIVKLGSRVADHDYYLKILFRTLIVQIAVISVGAFASAIRYNTANTSALNDTVTTTLQSHENRIRLLEREVAH